MSRYHPYSAVFSIYWCNYYLQSELEHCSSERLYDVEEFFAHIRAHIRRKGRIEVSHLTWPSSVPLPLVTNIAGFFLVF